MKFDKRVQADLQSIALLLLGVIAFCALIGAGVLTSAFLVQFSWNTVLHAWFEWREISFIESLAIVLCISFISSRLKLR